MKIHASGEDYLEAILVLKTEKGMVRSVDVARYVGVSKPSVAMQLMFYVTAVFLQRMISTLFL